MSGLTLDGTAEPFSRYKILRRERGQGKTVFPCSTDHGQNWRVCMYVCMVITYSKGKDQPRRVANPVPGQLNRETYFSLSPFAPENLVSRDGLGSPVPRQPAHLHTILRLNLVLTYGMAPEFREYIRLIHTLLKVLTMHTYTTPLERRFSTCRDQFSTQKLSPLTKCILWEV